MDVLKFLRTNRYVRKIYFKTIENINFQENPKQVAKPI